MGFDEKTLMWWERDERPPYVHAYPTLIHFLGYEPWPAPTCLAEALLAERRRRGLSIERAAHEVGVDEGTWRRWERKEWKPMRMAARAINQLLGIDVERAFPNDVR